MKHFKKLIALCLVGVMAFSLAACGETETTTNDNTAEAGYSQGQFKIGICQLVEHDALDNASQGFMDALNELFGEGVCDFDYQTAGGESTNCSTIVNGFVSDGVDLILANATAPLQAAASATDSIPILGTSVTDYAAALSLSDWSGTVGTNVSGTSDLAPLDQQAEMIVELFPDATKVGIVYCSAEANSLYQAQVIEGYLEEFGLEYKEFSFTDTNDVASVTQSACDYADVIYIPTDNTAASNTEAIANVVLPAGVPVIAGEEGICAGCGVATLSISYYSIGYATGKMAYEILANGADVSTMAVEYASDLTKEYNASNCEALGITVPDEYVAIEE